MKITAFGSMAYLTTKALYSPAYAYSGMSEGEAKLSRRQQRHTNDKNDHTWARDGISDQKCELGLLPI